MDQTDFYSLDNGNAGRTCPLCNETISRNDVCGCPPDEAMQDLFDIVKQHSESEWAAEMREDGQAEDEAGGLR